MKKGKTSKLEIFDNAKCSYGTVDAQNFKSLYISIQSWVQPTMENGNWDRITGNVNRQIKHNLIECVDPFTFESHNIVDLDLRSSGVQMGKKSFMNLEITLFIKSNVDFKSIILRDRIKQICKSIYQDELMGSKYFTMTKSKTKKV
tara:strand:- start:223 stop:660 length:438 start_codon:yes stop_codon:yes gene_type:complete